MNQNRVDFVGFDSTPNARALAQYDDSDRWNGWLRPSLDPHGVETVLGELRSCWSPSEFVEYGIDWSWADDGVLEVADNGDVDDDGNVTIHRLEPDADGLYWFGDFGFVWSRISRD